VHGARGSDGGAQVRRGGEMVHFEAFVQELQEHTVLYGNSIGFGGGNFTCGAFSQAVMFTAKFEAGPGRYEKGVDLIREVLFCTQFTPARLKVRPSLPCPSALHDCVMLCDVFFSCSLA